MATSIARFVEREDIEIECEKVGRRADGLFSDTDMKHYKCVLRRPGLRVGPLYYSVDKRDKKKPRIEEVLWAMVGDTRGFEDSGGVFTQWKHVDDFEDVDEAEKTYRAVASQAKELSDFFGGDLYEEWVYETTATDR